MWKSHGRPIDIETLTNELRLKIDDYSKNEELRLLIREYDELMSNYANSPVFIHTRNFI